MMCENGYQGHLIPTAKARTVRGIDDRAARKDISEKAFIKYTKFAQLMSLYIASLNSGSNGNCYYIGNDHEAVLIDAGLSCRETERRMRRLGLSMDRIKGVFISHEHDDHIRGLEVLSKRYQ
jgi:glyoxylase-like metal-dependent hydrolase (beta-lactamase superfamily II)